MSEDLGFAVKADAEFSLARAVQLGLHRHIDVLEKYSEAASKEYSLERALDSMHQNWRGVEFETSPWRDTGSFVLKGTDETQMLLDDQIVKTQSMRSSPYIGPFEDRVKLWEKKLTTIQEVLDQWLKMQSGWLYLEPIFGSDDIMQQMPAEGRKFKTVDTTWRKTMLKLELTSEVLVVGADEDLLGSLRKCNELLDEVNKGLSEYLETKRLAFPRFYFLSNDELLEILSETKDPLRVQPFLKKVFEAIHLLEFQKNMEVTAMLSEEGEKVTFVNSFNPAKAGGAVEKWLIQCEAAQRETVAAMCRDASKAYATSKRTDWMVEWPGQVVLCIGSLYWTSQTEAAIREGTVAAHARRSARSSWRLSRRCAGSSPSCSARPSPRWWCWRCTRATSWRSSRRRGALRGGLRLGVAAAVHLGHDGRREGWRDGAHDQRGDCLRERVPGELVAPGDHAADGPVLPHAHGRRAPGRRRRAGGPRGDGEDGNHEGSRQGDRHAVRGVQLLRRAGLPGDGQVFQGPRRIRRVGVLRRVQPHRPRGAVGDRAADPHHHARESRARAGVRLRRHAASPAAHVQRVHHHEPRLRRALGASRQFKGAVPHGGDDGPRLRHDLRGVPVLERLPGGALARRQAGRHV